MNNVSIVGRLAADPELRTTPSGVNVTSFRVAVRRDKDNTDWLDVVAWRKTAELVCSYFTKGSTIGITGSIQSRSYEDKNGNKRTAVEIVADNVHFVGGKSEGTAAPVPAPAAQAQTAPSAYDNTYAGFEPAPVDDGDLPF